MRDEPDYARDLAADCCLCGEKATEGFLYNGQPAHTACIRVELDFQNACEVKHKQHLARAEAVMEVAHALGKLNAAGNPDACIWAGLPTFQRAKLVQAANELIENYIALKETL
jgi:hypothetical protein